MSLTKVLVSKSCFYNDCVSHPGAGAHFVVALSKSHLPCLVLVELRKRWTDDRLGQTVTRLEPDYVVPNVLSPRDLVFRPDNMDETVPHEADKTLTDGRFSYQHYYSRFDQPKNYPAKYKKNIIGRKRGPAKTIFGQKSGPAPYRPYRRRRPCGRTTNLDRL